MALKEIEDAIVDELSKAFEGKVRKVDSLPGELTIELIQQLLIDAPGIYVAFIGGPAKNPGATTASFNGSWAVFAITRHASGQRARRRGDASSEIGAYEMIEIAVPRLHCLTIKDQGTLMFKAVQNLFSRQLDKKGVAIYAAQFEMPVSLDRVTDPELLRPFETFNSKLDIPTFGTTDAEDTVTLPQ